MSRKMVLHSILSLFIFLSVINLMKLAGGYYLLNQDKTIQFNGKQAYELVIEQVNMGPRTPGSPAHPKIINWIDNNLSKSGWLVNLQSGSIQGHLITNIIGKNSNDPPQIILAAHYDSRILSDKDQIERNRSEPVPGANDGASGVAILLELARDLPKNNSVPSIWLVFLDAEDNENISGWEGLLGSRYFVSKLEYKPRAAIILDMVGDKNLNIYKEINSNQDLTNEIWSIAKTLGYGAYLIDRPKYSIIDDHIPFIEAGIPAVDIIDFDYIYWHTAEDTIDKTSAESLTIVGSTVLNWLLNQP